MGNTKYPPALINSGAEQLSRLSMYHRRRRRVVFGFVVLFLAGAAAVWRFGLGQSSRDLEPYTVTAKRGSLRGLVTASGELEAVRKVNVSPKRQGLLKELYVTQGEQVAKNEAIALMDKGDFDDRLDELKAFERRDRADYEAKKVSFERRRRLYEQGAISADELSNYRNRFLTSQAVLNASRARVKQGLVEGRELIVRAPFAGIITQRYAEPGSFVTPTTAASASAGATSSSIVELSEGLEVAAKVSESDINRIRLGQLASVRVDAFPNQRFPAKVREISPRAEKTNNVISFEVELDLIDPPSELLIGMTTDVDFETGPTASTVLVPTVTIVTERGKPGVLIVADGDQPQFQSVELGNSSGKETAIIEGLTAGTRVFVDLPPWAPKR